MPKAMNDLVAAISGGTNLSTPEGWADAELLSLLAPAAAIVVAVMSAAAASAGEEEDKTLGLALSVPIGRGTFLFAKAVAMVVLDLIVAVCIGIGLEIGNVIGNLGFTAAGMIGAAAHALLLGLVLGGLALLVGSATGSKRAATVSATLVAVIAFAMNTFLPLSTSLAPVARYSPWYYYLQSNPLANGADGAHLALLGGIAAVLIASAVLVFRRRDLRG